VFVYRDMTSVEDDLAAAAAAEREAAQRREAERAAAEQAAAEREAAYWYGPAEPASAPEPAGETRGPFEPLVASGSASGPGAGAVAPEAASGAIDEPDVPDESEEPGDRHAQKLEQIKDFYLTAEAIGEKNVDKHFDQLLAQQRELISQYFKDSAAGRDDPAAAAAGDDTTEAGAAPADAAW
jgi:hypothetical protein